MSLSKAAIAASRFGYGAKPGELRAIAGDPQGWVKAQLIPERAPPTAIAALPPTEDDVLALGRFLIQQRLNNNNGDAVRKRFSKQGVTDQQMRELGIEDAYRQHFRARAETATKARLDVAMATERPVFERLTHFWSNHFTVSSAKAAASATPPSFERDAIRPHTVGRFSDMLKASSQHPGMLLYLDNWQSIGPNSTWGKNPRAVPRYTFGPGGQPSGLNENLAREILELHTLGVNGGYSQADVQSLAAIITGWMYKRPELGLYFSKEVGRTSGPDMFVFQADAHEPGPKTLLGKVYPQAGRDQGEAALLDLARKPATANFIATKLARHYVSDEPPPALVARMGDTFQRSDGDIAKTFATLVDSPEAWEQPFAKFKRPEEYFISAMRALKIASLPPGVGANAVGLMGQRLYSAAGPDGFSDIAAPWLTGTLVWKRIEWAQALADRVARADVDPVAVGDAVLGPLLSAGTREAVSRAESPSQGLVLLLASPEFQRR
jgi:uncharacterized protein (DUF1800 family)